ncbi:conserved hypothetical protein (plasmid) [Rhizobium leguminosarum bv. trifolii WSM2304]|uniref:N,N-dimethylformamidase beta subunit-like C-terminal domain-containing protein n=1 Tax=Rhizobium leguminosarum bv. trifolii (strain WSM2304) TaxID=395492 RepID=A0ABF7QVQ0_RHILW|nr:N,N-dimethylformamidase beta subunit family domain-containing protein [Rhizobium leguminosarum]ACI58226.1 conserved hypothetical protein [Rhizobium leguminosarum bv. trifolii WSM2304]
MRRLLNHSAMPVAGYMEPWSVQGGASTRAYLSCIDPRATYRVVSLDRDEQEVKDWPLQNHSGSPTVREYSLGSWVELPPLPDTSDEEWRFSFEFLPTQNATRRILCLLGDLAISIEAGGRLDVEIGNVTNSFAHVSNECWYSLSISKSVAGVAVLLAAATRKKEIARANYPGAAPILDRVYIGSDGSTDTKSFNGRIARISLGTADRQFSWNFPTRGPADRLGSIEDSELALKIHNMPTFCVASARFTAEVHDPRLEPTHFDAIHLHDDDFGGFDWSADLTIEIPKDARPGVFALEVTTEQGVERLPFFVRSAKPSSVLAFLVPTSTYLAYADERLPPVRYPWRGTDRGHRFSLDNDFLCLYDVHSDLSGVSLTSARRPRATLRDDYHYPLSNCPHLLPVDLQLLKFYAREGVAVDVLTDRDLHDEGYAAAAAYRGLLTGSHPEYWSSDMMKALDQFLEGGGNLAYLGGNGFYWVVAYQGETMELRRVKSDIWTGRPGESHMSITGEPGGNWEDRGLRNPQSYLGVTYLIMSFGRGRPYQRLAASFSREYDWLFKGVSNDPIGDSGAVLGGAAGYEIDAVVRSQETPTNLVRLATADGFDDSFQVRPEVWLADGNAERETLRRADMTIYRHAGGGQVFCTGSVAWIGALPAQGESNAVGQIMKNLAEGFS